MDKVHVDSLINEHTDSHEKSPENNRTCMNKNHDILTKRKKDQNIYGALETFRKTIYFK